MSLQKINRLAAPVLTLAVCVSVGLTACGESKWGQNGARTPQGTINLDGLKVGVPENVIKEAVLTFVLDDKPAAKAGGKSQYLSRSKDSNGGQYVAQCIGGSCYRLDALYDSAPIPKEKALETVKNMLPADAPPQSKVDDSELNKAGAPPVESIYYGTDYSVSLTFTDKDGQTVKSVSVTSIPKMSAFGSTDKKASEDAKQTAN